MVSRRRRLNPDGEDRVVTWCGYTVAQADDLLPWCMPSTTMFTMIGACMLLSCVVVVLTVECNMTWDPKKSVTHSKKSQESHGKGCLSGSLAGVDMLGFLALAFIAPIFAVCCFTFLLSAFAAANPRSASCCARRCLCMRVVDSPDARVDAEQGMGILARGGNRREHRNDAARMRESASGSGSSEGEDVGGAGHFSPPASRAARGGAATRRQRGASAPPGQVEMVELPSTISALYSNPYSDDDDAEKGGRAPALSSTTPASSSPHTSSSGGGGMMD